LLLAITGSIALAVLLSLRLFGLISLYGRIWPLLAVLLILTGVQFFVFGILADISVKNHYKVTGQESYQIKEIFEE